MKLYLSFSRSILLILLISLSAVTQAAMSYNDLIVTEVMANPSAVSDSNGEWFEIYNTTSQNIELNHLIIRDSGSNSHTLNSAFTLNIGSGEYFVLGNNGNTAENGGYLADYVYSSFTLANSNDDIILEIDGIEIFSLNYTSTSGFGTAGISMELAALTDFPASANDYQFTPNTLTYGDGDLGTPGLAGSNAVTSAVPLPASAWLFATAIVSLLRIRRHSEPN